MQGYWRFLLLVIFGLGSCAAPVRVEDLEGKTVSKVAIRPVGPTTTGDEVRLQKNIRTIAGSRYVSERVDEDIKALYESGLVNDVRVLAEPKKDGVEVIFEVQTRALIGPGPGFAGNTVFSDQRLAKESGLPVGQKVGRSQLRAAARRIEAYYEAHGYPGTKVSLRSDSDDRIFIVEEGPGPRQ
jgi:outer membrane protein insertion porin family